MPLNKKVKLLAQEFPELQTSRGWSLHWRLASPLLQSSLMLLMVVVGNCSVWTFTPSSLTSYFSIISYVSLFLFIDSYLVYFDLQILLAVSKLLNTSPQYNILSLGEV